MKVYICVYSIDYEGDSIKCVFDTPEKAEAWVNEKNKRAWRCGTYNWEEYEVE